MKKRNCLVIVLTAARRREKDQVGKNKREWTSKICICNRNERKKTRKKLKEKNCCNNFYWRLSVIFFWKNCTNTARRLLSFARDSKSWSEVKIRVHGKPEKCATAIFILNTFNCLVDGQTKVALSRRLKINKNDQELVEVWRWLQSRPLIES